jgi:threonine synthase
MHTTVLGEGNTPCIHSRDYGEDLWFKMESQNPTGSYKDRFAAPAIAALASPSPPTVIATSSGNTGAALAAYAARFGVRLAVVTGANAPPAKLAPICAHGAKVLLVEDFAEDPELTAAVLRSIEQFTERTGAVMVVSAFRYSPAAMEGVSAIATELAALAPRHVVIPVGGGGLYTAIARGFLAAGMQDVKLHAVQPNGGATVAGAWRQNLRTALPMPGKTAISGLSVPLDLDATTALGHLYACGGMGIVLEDGEIYQAQRRLFDEEGICAEPAGAAAFAAYVKARDEGLVKPGERAVCLITGHGWKDAASLASRDEAAPPISANQLLEALQEYAR